MNEEKEPMYFVWETRPHDGQYVAAKYAGKPLTGMGTEADKRRFVLSVELPESERHLSLKELAERYPIAEMGKMSFTSASEVKGAK